MMSQPASACTSACFTSTATVSSLRIVAVAHQAVMAVAGVGIERHVAQDADLRHFLLDGADRLADQIVRVERLAAVLVAQVRIGVGKQRDAGDGRAWPRARPRAPRHRPRAARRRASRRPARAFAPSTTNSGQIRSSVVSTFSRTMRRAHSDCAVAAQAGGEIERRRALAGLPRPGRRARGLRSGGRI